MSSNCVLSAGGDVQVNGYWLECQGLPNRLKDWEAYVALRTAIAHYIQIIPVLKQLASKV